MAAYSYMALVPIIQPPIMPCTTTDAERQVVMSQLRPVSSSKRPVSAHGSLLCLLFLPSAHRPSAC